MQCREYTTLPPATGPLHMLLFLPGTFCEALFKYSNFLFILQISILLFLKEASPPISKHLSQLNDNLYM